MFTGLDTGYGVMITTWQAKNKSTSVLDHAFVLASGFAFEVFSLVYVTFNYIAL
ncbi:hypothetical protein DL95DRAFT_60489 [Leptodontidium sp. 2 PMI_412]|nr:hypothetical protein DL95DRAFT_60489 [Leptodontidium sp. 2 PMI_412]